MPIPKEILAVERPKNTIVIVYGKDKNLYAVRQRIGCKNIDGRHVPVNGPTIGHIVDGEYIPLIAETKNVSSSPIDLKNWADVILCDRLFKDIQNELVGVYNNDDVLKIYCISILRVCNPGIRDYELKEAYDTSFLSEIYPGVALSKNIVSVFLYNLGKTVSRITEFMRKRTAAVSLDHYLLIDGTMKSDESSVNSLSNFSRKALTKGTRDISVLYAFDLETVEPVCSECFPENMLDVTSYKSFIKDNGITKGIIAADKGFPESATHIGFESNPDLHYMNPIKRNSKFIKTHNMLEFTDILPGYEYITFRKEKCNSTNKWLYSFRDSYKAAKEEQDWLRRAKKDGTYDADLLKQNQVKFGTVILECDLDIPAETAYKAYSKRLEIEIVMRYYKSACEFDDTHVQDDYSVIGSEFCDFLSALLTFRLIKEFDKEKLLEKHTYKKILSILTRAKKVKIDGENWQIVQMDPSQTEILQNLGIVEKTNPEPKKKRGRPKKTEE